MNTVKVVFSHGKKIKAERGTALSDILKSIGLKMDFPCGGLGKCGQCKVNIAPLKEKENKQQVLSCLYPVDQDLWVDIPADLENLGTVILTTGIKTNTSINSGIEKIFFPGDSLNQKGQSYWEIIEQNFAEQNYNLNPTLDILQRFAQFISRNKKEGLTLVFANKRLIDLEQGNTTNSCYGLAVDVGTTTVVGYLMDLLTGEEIAVEAGLNGQRTYGADVISRIAASRNSELGLPELQKRVVNTINNIIEKVTGKSGIAPRNIYSITLAGNTCMHHLLLGLNPGSLGRAPFLPIIQKNMVFSAAELGLAINPHARAWVFPVIAGFVGGDTVAAILASNFHQQKDAGLLIDIGTNGELVVNANGRMVATSAAAGPALEGAQITFGMRAEKGAIRKVKLLPFLELDIIGGGTAKGICGSGLIDLLAELIKAKLINKRGKLIVPEQYSGPEYLLERLDKGKKGRRFILLKADENNGQEIYFTQADILQLQLAKGALRAAMELLVDQVGVQRQALKEILLAGAFGNLLDQDQAQIIGLLPDWGECRVRLIGNAAGEGAKLALLSQEQRVEAERIIRAVEFLELAGKPAFEQAFIQGLLF